MYAVGEVHEGTACDFGWIRSEASGRAVWSMAGREWEPAGGDAKNGSGLSARLFSSAGMAFSNWFVR